MGTQSQSVRLMSKSIADEILQAKQEQEKQEKKQKEESEGSKKEYKPWTICSHLQIVTNMGTISWTNTVHSPFSVKDFKDSKVFYIGPKRNLRNHSVKNFCRIHCRRVIFNQNTLFVSNLLVSWFMPHGVINMVGDSK